MLPWCETGELAFLDGLQKIGPRRLGNLSRFQHRVDLLGGQPGVAHFRLVGDVTIESRRRHLVEVLCLVARLLGRLLEPPVRFLPCASPTPESHLRSFALSLPTVGHQAEIQEHGKRQCGIEETAAVEGRLGHSELRRCGLEVAHITPQELHFRARCGHRRSRHGGGTFDVEGQWSGLGRDISLLRGVEVGKAQGSELVAPRGARYQDELPAFFSPETGRASAEFLFRFGIVGSKVVRGRKLRYFHRLEIPLPLENDVHGQRLAGGDLFPIQL
jgi:hypothetical protein